MRVLLFFCVLHATPALAFLRLPISEVRNIKISDHQLLTESELNLVAAKFMVGTQYHKRQMHLESFEYFFFCREFLEFKNCEASPFYSLSLSHLANIYYKVYDFQTAKALLLEWHGHKYQIESLRSSLYNTLALIYLQEQEYDSTLYFFNEGLRYAQFRKQEVWEALIHGGIGMVHHDLNQWDKAKFHIKRKIDITEQSLSTYESTANSLSVLASIAIEEDSISLAKNYLQEAERFYALYGREPSFKFYHIKANFFNKTAQFDSAYYYAGMEKQALATEDKNVIKFSSIHLRTTEKQKKAEVEILGKRHSLRIRTYLVTNIIIVLLSVVLIIWLFQKLKSFYSQNLHAKHRIDRINEELDKNQGEIAVLRDDLVQKINSLAFMENTVVSLTQQTEEYNREDQISLLKSKTAEIKLLTEENWNDFKRLYGSAYPKFLESLIQQKPNVSSGEQRLACMMRLNLTTYEMADMTGVSHESVKKSLLRFKKKMEYDTQTELTDFIFSLPS